MYGDVAEMRSNLPNNQWAYWITCQNAQDSFCILMPWQENYLLTGYVHLSIIKGAVVVMCKALGSEDSFGMDTEMSGNDVGFGDDFLEEGVSKI
jgi:hypothetical protein